MESMSTTITPINKNLYHIDPNMTYQLFSDASERLDVLDAMRDNHWSMSLAAYKKSLHVPSWS